MFIGENSRENRQTVPKYSKVELIISKGLCDDEFEEYEDCGMVITGNHLVIVLDLRDETGETNASTEGIIYKLNEIKRYKTYKN